MKKSTWNLWLAWIIVTFFYAYQYILRVMPSILMEDIVTKFSLTPDAFGQFSAVYYLGYSLMHLPVGIFLDRFGPRRVLPLLIVSTSLGLLPLLYSEIFIYPILGRVLIGIGSSGAILGVFKVLHMYFPPARFSRFLSFSVTFGLLGAIYGGAPVHLARLSIGFEKVVFVLICVSIVLAAIAFFALPADSDIRQHHDGDSLGKNLRQLFANKELWFLSLVAGFMVGPLEGFADVWGVQFLKVFHGLAPEVAAGLPSWMFFGMCFGGPLLSFIAERRGSYLHVVLGAGCVMTIGFGLLLTVKLSVVPLSVLFFVVGICCAYQILMIYQVSTLVHDAIKSLSSVAANMIIMTFGYGFHTLIGRCIGSMAGSGNVDAFQNGSSLALGIAIIPVALLGSCIALAGYIVATHKRPLRNTLQSRKIAVT